MPRALPSSGNTIKNWIIDQFHWSQQDLTRLFTCSKSKIHFTFDLWTSPNYRAFLGIVTHWLDQNYKLQSTVIGMRRFYGQHTGENQANCFFNIIKPYEINDKIGYFTLDNASNNRTTMQHIAKQLMEEGISFDPIERRLRCFGHVINLVVKAFLWETEAEAFEAQITNHQALHLEAEELDTWRRKGPLGKLHNIIVWISLTPQRRDRFAEHVKKALGPGTKVLSLINGNSTRWGGDYDSLIRALELCDPLEEYIALIIHRNEDQDLFYPNSPYSLGLDELTPTDWDILKEIMYILQPFRKWQLILQKKAHFGQLT